MGGARPSRLQPALDGRLRARDRELGFDPVRADQDLGDAIIMEMTERLAISDLVIADITVPNHNVYYQVGVRHATSETHCVMIAAEWTKPLFDVDQMRQVRYPLPVDSIDDATAERIRRILVERVPRLAKGRSPVYEFYLAANEGSGAA